ncbi:hypothetical protein Hypma_010980 [Hypsizygus marmoreus]|uniref:Uncharacterized protein n=1 Tax=Hypsizygus marmoreus TaxID=39966 RepID=A0A369JNE2_HYPMA|nr:hypothetical protein Hypma_010980 [Hypsizygus marmoreus]
MTPKEITLLCIFILIIILQAFLKRMFECSLLEVPQSQPQPDLCPPAQLPGASLVPHIILLATIPISLWHRFLGANEDAFVVSVAWAQAVWVVYVYVYVWSHRNTHPTTDIPTATATTTATDTPTLITVACCVAAVTVLMILLSILGSGKEPAGVLGMLARWLEFTGSGEDLVYTGGEGLVLLDEEKAVPLDEEKAAGGSG